MSDLDILVQFDWPLIDSVSSICVSRPMRIALPSPALAKLLAARIMRSSSPSAKTTRLRIDADMREDALQGAGDRIEAGRKLDRICVEIGDMAAGHARIHRRLGDRHRDARNEARIERARDEIARAELQPRAVIGGGDFVGHVLAREAGKRLGGGDLHVRR